MDSIHIEWYKGELHIRLETFFPTTKKDTNALLRVVLLDFCNCEDITNYIIKHLQKRIANEKMLKKHPDEKLIKKLQKNLSTVQEFREKNIL